MRLYCVYMCKSLELREEFKLQQSSLHEQVSARRKVFLFLKGL